VVGISEIQGKHGVYAKSPSNTHALYVQGAAHITGPTTGYHVDIFVNASGKTLKTGDLVRLEGSTVDRFDGDGDKIPIAKATLADEANARMTIGVVDRKAVPIGETPPSGTTPDDPATIENGEDMYVVTLGGYAQCKVDDSGGPIEVGDLLTPSDEPGFAKKAVEPQIGAIIGKALQPFDSSSSKAGNQHIALFVNIQ
jgi:hypothetical protein